MGSQQFTVFVNSAAGSYRTLLYGLIRYVLVKLKCLESVRRLLDDISEIAVQLSLYIVYRYDGYCCICHGEDIEMGRLIILV